MSIFQSAEILIARGDLRPWAVIACDQFTSNRDYWRRARKIAGENYSSINLILPEAELGSRNVEQKIEKIHETMREYLWEDIFAEFPDSYVYVERELQSGAMRRGLIGCIDLEKYDYNPGSTSPVRPTEKTVLERIPPRLRVREGAVLELPHVLLLCDDPEMSIIEPLTPTPLRLLYSVKLMLGGRRLRAWLVDEKNKEITDARIAAYEAAHRDLCYAVGDGNHSLAAAKAAYEKNPTPLNRYALVELVNVRDYALEFEPIHRIVTETDPEALLAALEQTCGAPEGFEVGWAIGEKRGTVTLDPKKGELAVAVLQAFLDEWLQNNAGKIDYIHDDAALLKLAAQENAIGFLLPAMEKSQLFRGVARDGVLPRKTFSMGHAKEKRYYVEARRIG